MHNFSIFILTRSFFEDKLRVELKRHDILRSPKDGNIVYNNKIEGYQLNRNDTREIELTIRYKFNSARSKYKGIGAGSTEIDRL